jgi:hypothetical protein
MSGFDGFEHSKESKRLISERLKAVARAKAPEFARRKALRKAKLEAERAARKAEAQVFTKRKFTKVHAFKVGNVSPMCCGGRRLERGTVTTEPVSCKLCRERLPDSPTFI